MRELSELGRAALDYVERGFGVVPLLPRSKKPAVDGGLNSWTDNPEDVEQWWATHPDHNIGIVCGTPSNGLLVLDFDIDEEADKDGLATLSEWERAHGELPATAVAITGGGGMHYLYRTDRTNIHPSANAELGVDVRSDRSYIVAPPSVHPNGSRYEWQDPPDETPIAMATGAVYDFLDHVQRNGGEDETRKPNGKFRLPDVIRKGERDNVLFKYASHLRAIGRSDEEIVSAVAGANVLRCEPPLDSRDVERIARSACRYEQGSADAGRGAGRPGSKAAAAGIRGPRGGIRTNELAKVVMDSNRATIIDGAPAVWTGERWEFGKAAVERCALEVADDAKAQDRAEVFKYVMAKAPHATSDAMFDGRYYVQFADCTWDVLGERKVKPEPYMQVSAELPVPLDLDAAPNLADAFLDSLAAGDPVVRQALAEVAGACMCSRIAMDRSPMLIGRAGGAQGKASNGKSTYINWLRSLLGPGNVSSLDIETLGQRFQAGYVMGKLANLGDDIPDGFLSGTELSTFKKLVTGDEIFTDVKGADGFTFRPTATMVFSMNAMPRLADTTDGIFRRLYFVPFRNRFAPGTEGFDRDIASKLSKPEVLRRGAVIGLMALGDLLRRGEPVPIPDMAAEVEEVRQDSDSVARWLADEDVTPAAIDGVPVAEAYRRYVEWCAESGERNPCSKRTASARIRESSRFAGVTVVTEQRKIGGRNIKVFNIQTG